VVMLAWNRREGIDTARILRLTDEYYARGWGRHYVKDGHVAGPRGKPQ